jgi:hypothetical protein
MGYIKEEQETVLVFDYFTGEWNVYSTVPKHIRKLMSLGEMKIIESEDDRPIAVQGKLPEKFVAMRKPKVVSDEQRAAMSERMKGRKTK